MAGWRSRLADEFRQGLLFFYRWHAAIAGSKLAHFSLRSYVGAAVSQMRASAARGRRRQTASPARAYDRSRISSRSARNRWRLPKPAVLDTMCATRPSPPRSPVLGLRPIQGDRGSGSPLRPSQFHRPASPLTNSTMRKQTVDQAIRVLSIV